MDERIAKLELFMLTPEAESAFTGTLEETLANLKAQDIELTFDELKAFLQGINDGNRDELNENDLETVAGGATYPGYERDCYNAGRKLCKVLKWVWRIGKYFAV